MKNENSASDKLPENLTIPKNLQLSARGFADENYARDVAYNLHSIMSVLSQYIDLTYLDGVTIAFDYNEALAGLNRGYKTNYKLSATKDAEVGVAMAPRVIRNGKIKTHLVINADIATSIFEDADKETGRFNQSIYAMAHECAHVEVTAAFDKCFPNTLLQKVHTCNLDELRWKVILATWDEYAACRISGFIGCNPVDEYLGILIKVLGNTRGQCYEMIKAYRIHGDIREVVVNVYGKLGDLLKYASYYLGASTAHEKPETHPSALIELSEFKWFRPFYNHLGETHMKIWDQFGKWENQNDFEVIGNILEEMAESIGLEASRQPDGEIYFAISYRRETMPDMTM